MFSERRSMMVRRTADTVLRPVAAKALSVDYIGMNKAGGLPVVASKSQSQRRY